jgi:glucosamine--fructose-6-phosphate aminotransferase (isomerizing)
MIEKTAFLRDVDEQPAALRRLVEYYRKEGAELLHRWHAAIKDEKKVMFCGMGSSEFAVETILPALYGRGVEAGLVDAGEFLHYPRPFDGLKVLISQSGESAETRKLAEQAAGKFVAVTNNPSSAIAKLAQLNLPMMAGEEDSISTKTYSNTLGLLHLMVQKSGDTGQALDRLDQVAAAMHAVPQAAFEKAADVLAGAPALQFIARGPSMASAKESALAFMEGSRLIAAALTGGNFRHGPLELSDAKHYCVIFIPQSPNCHLQNRLAAELTDKGSHVVVITDQPLNEVPAVEAVISVPAHGEDLFPLVVASVHARLLDALARRRGLVAGVFRYSGKITTTE